MTLCSFFPSSLLQILTKPWSREITCIPYSFSQFSSPFSIHTLSPFHHFLLFLLTFSSSSIFRLPASPPKYLYLHRFIQQMSNCCCSWRSPQQSCSANNHFVVIAIHRHPIKSFRFHQILPLPSSNPSASIQSTTDLRSSLRFVRHRGGGGKLCSPEAAEKRRHESSRNQCGWSWMWMKLNGLFLH